ncbi:unnamed protein product [Lymnaea stagnalis]|uniref:ADAM10 endopeptidase n=1 Tax=Lymnaea stagnalis TaxID=6523 RepID=A0AAV2IME0_LYMST
MSAQGWVVLAVVVIATQHSIGIDGAPLNDYILDYQPLHFDQIHLHDKHSRVRRSVDPYFRWIFKAYNRTFNVQLQPSSSIFAENHELIFGDEPPKKVDTSFIYEGILAGEPSSSVHMSIIDGSVSGHIIVPGHTTYHIEPARNHFNHSDFHTIIYPESRMNLDPYRHKRSASGICGDREVYEKLSKMWRPVEEPSFRHIRESSSEHSLHNKYSAEANSAKSRQRRQLEEGKKTCFMSLRADKLLYDHFMAKTKNNAEKAKEEILSLFGSHVKALNDIYLTTVFNTFDDTIRSRGVGFQLQRSTVITGCGSGTWQTGYCTDNLDVSNFLDLTADENHDTFCLVHTFTYRDFVGGTLGLAWVATPDSRNSGVCGKYGAVRDDKNGISDRSLNTGIVTLINFNQEVPTRVSQLTFAHEVGHNFGAQHDAKAECAPYGTSQPDSSSGNYIMFPSATQGNLPNNAKFSSCSKNDIAKVLDTLAPKGKRNNCFQTSKNAFCGNGVVEANEKCDCGYEEDCKDECCYFQTNLPSNSSCTLRKGECSPTQGQCCASSCTYQSQGTPCLAETDCNDASSCNGNAATCPPPSHKENRTFCNNFNKVCELGECIGSVCSRIDWIECFMTVAQGATDEQMCYISCKESESSECISSYDQGKVDANAKFKDLLMKIRDGQKSTTLGLKRPSGSPCNDYKGFCDVFSKCKNVDAEGPFKQLTDLIFNPLTLRNIRTWIEDHWWAVLLMCIGVVVFMGVFIKIFGYNTPSKNPKKKPQGPLAGRSVPAGPRPASRAVAPKPRHEQKQNVFATDLPMYARPTSDRGRSDQHIYDRPDYNDGRYGYDNQAFQGPSHSRGHQQYDRVAGSRNY